MTNTPGLDRLTAETRELYLRLLKEGTDELHQPAQVSTVSAEVIGLLRDGDEASVSALIRALYRVFTTLRLHHPLLRDRSGEDRADGIAKAASTTTTVEMATGLYQLLDHVEGILGGDAKSIRDGYTNREVSTVLLELYCIGEEEFDPDREGNDLDYNADDALPERCETPHNHLGDLADEAVTARLIKRHGRELLLAWVNAGQ